MELGVNIDHVATLRHDCLPRVEVDRVVGLPIVKFSKRLNVVINKNAETVFRECFRCVC